MSGYYDMDGQPLGLMAWAKLLEDHDARIIGRTERGDVTVSTVWIGLDHSFGDGPPLIFETMIFGGDHDQDQWRYSTREEAETGHEAACALAFGVAA